MQSHNSQGYLSVGQNSGRFTDRYSECNFKISLVLSIQHQTVHIFQIERGNGHLTPILKIGRFLAEDDQMYVNESETDGGSERCFTSSSFY